MKVVEILFTDPTHGYEVCLGWRDAEVATSDGFHVLAFRWTRSPSPTRSQPAWIPLPAQFLPDCLLPVFGGVLRGSGGVGELIANEIEGCLEVDDPAATDSSPWASSEMLAKMIPIYLDPFTYGLGVTSKPLRESRGGELTFDLWQVWHNGDEHCDIYGLEWCRIPSVFSYAIAFHCCALAPAFDQWGGLGGSGAQYGFVREGIGVLMGAIAAYGPGFQY